MSKKDDKNIKEKKAKPQKEKDIVEKAPKKQNSKTVQYIGIALLMLAFVLIAIVSSATGEENLTENVVMSVAVAICVVLAVINYMTISIVATAAAVVAFVAFKISKMMVGSDVINTASYMWLVIPVIAVVGIALFMNGQSSLQLDNALLKQQVAELVMIDPITGLYNLRSLFMDIQSQISYSERNNTPISLMIVRLRYPLEMKKVLKKSEYEKVLKQLSLLLVDTVRLEDKVYNLDDNGGFGIILTCDKKGTKIVEKRLRDKLKDPKWFEGVSPKHPIRTELMIGYLQYDKNKYNRDANSFKESVEEEVSYDVGNDMDYSVE